MAKKNKQPTSNTSATAMMNYFSPPVNDIMKANIPGFLYKPPYGYPRKLNVPHLRDIAKTPYVFSIIKTLSDEAAGTKWSVRVKEDYADDQEAQALAQEVTLFLTNPNGNDESFEMINKAVIKDVLELDSGVIVKVFNKEGKLSQLFARDAGSFLKNPDVYGYMGGRQDFITPEGFPATKDSMTAKQYGSAYSDAAYFQYGWTTGGHPIPFGKREIMYIMHNPKTNSIYGTSPIEVLTNTIYMLIYGQQYNLDYYMNGNVPDGIIHLPNADKVTAKSFAQRLLAKFKKVDDLGNKTRVGHQYPVWSGEMAPSLIPFMLSAKDMQILEQQKWFIKLVWACFGVTPDEMGFTEDSNKAVAQSQSEVHKRKAVQPILDTLQYHYTTQILTEFDPMGRLEFVFDDYDIDEETKKMALHQQELLLGIKTKFMIAEEEGIDIAELKSSQDEVNEIETELLGVQSESTEVQQNTKDKKLKSFRYGIGNGVKIISDNPGYTGICGHITDISTTKNNEFIYKVTFNDRTFISVFENEMRCVDRQIEDAQPEPKVKESVGKLPVLAGDNSLDGVNQISKIKAFNYKVNDTVKVITDNPGYTGMVGKIEEVNTNINNEYVFTLRFKDNKSIKVFDNEIKSIETTENIKLQEKPVVKPKPIVKKPVEEPVEEELMKRVTGKKVIDTITKKKKKVPSPVQTIR